MKSSELNSMMRLLTNPKLAKTGTKCHLVRVTMANQKDFVDSLNPYELIGLKSCFRICSDRLDRE